MAFEYDGEQHFKFPNWFQKSQEAFEKLQADDAKKTLLYEQHGIKLYRVPYWVKLKALPEFVSDAVFISVSTPFDPGRKLGINMTSCRVEIFHMGRVPRDRLYYLDITSLYPWAGTKFLPYGEPVWVEKVDPKTFTVSFPSKSKVA